MKEGLAAATTVFAGAGLLTGCNSERPSPPPQELVIAHQTDFGEGAEKGVITTTKFAPLEVGA